MPTAGCDTINADHLDYTTRRRGSCNTCEVRDSTTAPLWNALHVTAHGDVLEEAVHSVYSSTTGGRDAIRQGSQTSMSRYRSKGRRESSTTPSIELVGRGTARQHCLSVYAVLARGNAMTTARMRLFRPFPIGQSWLWRTPSRGHLQSQSPGAAVLFAATRSKRQRASCATILYITADRNQSCVY